MKHTANEQLTKLVVDGADFYIFVYHFSQNPR